VISCTWPVQLAACWNFCWPYSRFTHTTFRRVLLNTHNTRGVAEIKLLNWTVTNDIESTVHRKQPSRAHPLQPLGFEEAIARTLASNSATTRARPHTPTKQNHWRIHCYMDTPLWLYPEYLAPQHWQMTANHTRRLHSVTIQLITFPFEEKRSQADARIADGTDVLPHKTVTIQ